MSFFLRKLSILTFVGLQGTNFTVFDTLDTVVFPYSASTANSTFTAEQVLLSTENSSYIPSFDAYTQSFATTGISSYVLARNVFPSVAYMTSLISWLIIFGAATCVSLFAWALTYYLQVTKGYARGAQWVQNLYSNCRSFTIANALRIVSGLTTTLIALTLFLYRS